MAAAVTKNKSVAALTATSISIQFLFNRRFELHAVESIMQAAQTTRAGKAQYTVRKACEAGEKDAAGDGRLEEPNLTS